jgi:hypothetical protein
MRPPNLALLAISLGLAVSLAYVAHELRGARARALADASEIQQLRARIETAERRREALERVVAAPSVAAPAQPVPDSPPVARVVEPEKRPATDPERRSGLSERQRARRAEHLKMLADPAARALYRVEKIAEARHQNPGLARALGLDPEQEREYFELLADQELRGEEYTLRRDLEADGGVDDSQQRHERDEEEQRTLLGLEKFEQFRQYQRSVPERAQITSLRARLDGMTALGEEQATRLINALREERERYVQSLPSSSGGEIAGHSGQYPFTPFRVSAEGRPDLAFAEAQLPRTEEFLKRLHARAAVILTPEQLRRFEEIQEEQMMMERRRLQWMRRRAAEQ